MLKFVSTSCKLLSQIKRNPLSLSCANVNTAFRCDVDYDHPPSPGVKNNLLCNNNNGHFPHTAPRIMENSLPFAVRPGPAVGQFTFRPIVGWVIPVNWRFTCLASCSRLYPSKYTQRKSTDFIDKQTLNERQQQWVNYAHDPGEWPSLISRAVGSVLFIFWKA